MWVSDALLSRPSEWHHDSRETYLSGNLSGCSYPANMLLKGSETKDTSSPGSSIAFKGINPLVPWVTENHVMTTVTATPLVKRKWYQA